MRKRLIIIASMATVLMAFGMVGTITAHSFRTGDNVDISNNEVIDETLFTSGRTIDINTTVNGDVFCAGQNVTVGGTINGDVMCAAQTITINGTINGDVRLAAQTVAINATVTGNATIASQSFTLGSDAQVQGDVSIGASDSTLNGAVGRDVAVGGANVTISDTIGRNVYGTFEHLRLTGSANVQGNISYTSKNELTKAASAVVAGTVNQTVPTEQPRQKSPGLFGISFAWFVYWLLAMVVAGFALVLLIPRFVHRSSERALERPLQTLLVGFLACVAVPVLLILLAITLVGIPLAVALGLAWLVILMAGGSFFAYLIGRIVYRRADNVFLVMLIGTVIIVILHYIPFIGFLAFLATLWFGTGMLLSEVYDHTPRPTYRISNLAVTAGSQSSKRK